MSPPLQDVVLALKSAIQQVYCIMMQLQAITIDKTAVRTGRRATICQDLAIDLQNALQAGKAMLDILATMCSNTVQHLAPAQVGC